MTRTRVFLAGIDGPRTHRLGDLERALALAKRLEGADVVHRTVAPDARVLKLLQELAPHPPFRDEEPVEEHVGPVVTSFDQALYLIKKGLL